MERDSKVQELSRLVDGSLDMNGRYFSEHLKNLRRFNISKTKEQRKRNKLAIRCGHTDTKEAERRIW